MTCSLYHDEIGYDHDKYTDKNIVCRCIDAFSDAWWQIIEIGFGLLSAFNFFTFFPKKIMPRE
jgi:hypothetical protein